MGSTALPDLYVTLGVARDAGEMEIRGAYGRAVLASQEPGRSRPSRELLDFALTTLTDPELRARYDAQAPVEGATTDGLAPSRYVASAAFEHARNGALWFAGGGLVTALSYAGAGAGGKYFIAWGAVIFGAVQLLRGLVDYVRVPAGTRTGGQIALLAVLIAGGAISSGWVMAHESGVIEDATLAGWNASIDKAELVADRASDLFQQVSERSGMWSAQDSADMREASRLYAEVADILTSAPVDSSLAWYRDGLVLNYRDAAAITGAFAGLSAQSTEADFESLNQRWAVRITDLRTLNQRFTNETGASR